MARTRAQDYDLKRSVILDKSAELFANFGFHGTSIMMIAEACGTSKALFYHYYSDKEVVLFDILHDHLKTLVNVTEIASRSTKNPQERLYLMCAALLDAYKDADAKHQIQIANLKLLPKRRQESLRAMERMLVRLFSDCIADAVPELKRNKILVPITMSLFGMLNWHYLWFREGKLLTRAQYAKLVAGLIDFGAAAAARSAVISTLASANSKK